MHQWYESCSVLGDMDVQSQIPNWDFVGYSPTAACLHVNGVHHLANFSDLLEGYLSQMKITEEIWLRLKCTLNKKMEIFLQFVSCLEQQMKKGVIEQVGQAHNQFNDLAASLAWIQPDSWKLLQGMADTYLTKLVTFEFAN